MGRVHETAHDVSSGWQGRRRSVARNFSPADSRRRQKIGFETKVNVSLQGKVAVVTGAGRGLGRQVAVTLAGCGAEVVAVARTAEQLRQTEQTIQQAGGAAWAMAADISRPDAVEKLKTEVEQRSGRV